ncbi:hypothetical protein Tsubulata_049082, partial [Turnera subulata]
FFSSLFIFRRCSLPIVFSFLFFFHGSQIQKNQALQCSAISPFSFHTSLGNHNPPPPFAVISLPLRKLKSR